MLTTPGVYFEFLPEARPAPSILRTDIAGFAGYTERGPLQPAGLEPRHAAVKLASWREFLSVFGAPLAFGYLGEAVRGFFANGGAACYVVRVAAPAARSASIDLMGSAQPGATPLPVLRLTAMHGELRDPRTGRAEVEQGSPKRYQSPGAWGNRLSVTVDPASLGNTTSVGPQPEDGLSTTVASLSGFEKGSYVRLIQAGAEAASYRRVAALVPMWQQLVWDAPLTEVDRTQPFRLETVEFALQLLLDGQIVEQHGPLSLDPEHSRAVVRVLQAESVFVDALSLVAASALSDPNQWPAATEPAPFTGGYDGLPEVTQDDFLAALNTLAGVDEVSLLALPDLVLRALQPQADSGLPPVGPDCANLEPLPTAQLKGSVHFVDAQGANRFVAGVSVRALVASGEETTTNNKGVFTLGHLPEGQVTLRLQRGGFEQLETIVQTRSGLTTEVSLTLAPILLPPAFSDDTVAAVQAAMAAQGEAGLYRVALLDPPESRLDLEGIQTWRTRFDTTYAALYFPWIVINDASAVEGVRRIPPSGHVAGLIARTDLSQGVHRAPANFPLEGVKALSTPVGEAEQGILNPKGINCLRALPGRGIRCFGARTLSSDAEWRYLNVRRLLLMIEEAVEKANQWAVFEPNNELLRQYLRYSLNSFLDTLWRQGALAGNTAAAAYQVKCDLANNPAALRDAGQLVAEIGVAPTIPFEFIHFKLGRTVDALTVTE